MSRELLELNNVYDPEQVEALENIFVDTAMRENPNRPGQIYRGLTRQDAESILHRLWFMGFDVKRRS